MKKLICAVLALLFCAAAFAQGIDLSGMTTDELKVVIDAAEAIINDRRTGFTTLDEYIGLHNEAMHWIGSADNCHICRAHGPLKKGEVNDTFTFSICDDPDSFAMLIVEKDTENILGAFACLSHTGHDNKPPRFLFEYIASVGHGTGFLKDKYDLGVISYLQGADILMNDLGLYESNAFAFGNASTVLNESGNMEFSYACNETLGICFTVSMIE